MIHGLYTLEELTCLIEKEFHLDPGLSSNHDSNCKAVMRALKNEGLWENAKVLNKPGTKQKSRHFSEYDLRAILSTESLYKYLQKRSKLPEIKFGETYDEVLKTIESERDEYYDRLEEIENNRDDQHQQMLTGEEKLLRKIYLMVDALFRARFIADTENKIGSRHTPESSSITIEDLQDQIHEILQMTSEEYFHDLFLNVEPRRNYKIDEESIEYYNSLPDDVKKDLRLRKLCFMVEALFDMYFTEFNDQLMLYDYDRAVLYGDLDQVPDEDMVEVHESRKRLNHPEGAYFTRRKDVNFTEQIQR